MKRTEHHLAAALEQLVGAAQAFTPADTRRRLAAEAGWREEYLLQQAVEQARRALAQHRPVARAPAEVLLELRGRTQ